MDFFAKAQDALGVGGDAKAEGESASAGGFSIGGVDLKQASDMVHQAADAVDKAVENDMVKSSGYADQVVQAQQLLHTADEKLQSVNTPAAGTPASDPPAQKQ